jgi:inosine/xanthosine triphosphate pyrophosphatase family protein
MPEIIFASRNKGKIQEVKDILVDTGLHIISLLD